MTALPPASPGNGRTRLLAVAALVLTLAAGIGIGWGAGHRRLWGPPREPGRPGEPGREMPSPSHMMAQRLGLSAAQEKQVDSIFAARRIQIGAFWDGPGARLRQIVDSTAVDIRSVLDSTQRVEFDKLQKRRGAMRGPGGMMGAPEEHGGPGRPDRDDDRAHDRRPPDGGPPLPPRDR